MAVKYTRKRILDRSNTIFSRRHGVSTSDILVAKSRNRIVIVVLTVLLGCFLLISIQKTAYRRAMAIVTEKEQRMLTSTETEYLVKLDVQLPNRLVSSGATIEAALWDALNIGDTITVEYKEDPVLGIKIVKLFCDTKQ